MIEYLAGSESGRKALSDSGFEFVRRSYDWETLGRKLCDTYEGWLREEK